MRVVVPGRQFGVGFPELAGRCAVPFPADGRHQLFGLHRRYRLRLSRDCSLHLLVFHTKAVVTVYVQRHRIILLTLRRKTLDLAVLPLDVNGNAQVSTELHDGRRCKPDAFNAICVHLGADVWILFDTAPSYGLSGSSS